MRKTLFWYIPIGAALMATVVFAFGFYSYLQGDTGTPVNLAPSRPIALTAPRGTIVPIILGDSLARGTGDESGLGIGGRFVEELRRRRINTKNIVNLGINGARTVDLTQQLNSRNVRVLLAESNVIIVSIGGNDLWGDNFRNAAVRDPQAVMNGVLDRIERVVSTIRTANPRARIFIIGLYNPFVSTPFGRILTPMVSQWNARLVERFAHDPDVDVVQTSDLFVWHDRLSFDRFHPGQEGYTMIARRIADAF